MYDLDHLVRDARGNDSRLALAALRALEDELDWLLVRAVRMAREDGYEWGAIGRLLGRSRQAVRERFDRLAPKVGPIPPHLRGRDDTESHLARLNESLADARRRREFEGGNPIFW